MSDWKNVQYKDGKMRTSEGGGGGGSSTFAGLDDVDFSDIQNGQVPKYNSETQKWENADESGGASALADLTDVNLTNIQDGQIIKWDNATQKFVNANESGGGSGGGSITTLSSEIISTLNQSYNLSDDISNYDFVIFHAYYTGGDNYPEVVTSVFVPSRVIAQDRRIWASGGNNDRAVQLKFPTNTTVVLLNTNQNAVKGIYGIKLYGNSNTYRHDYSTTEQTIGTWIDGKPVYEKVLVFTPTSESYTVDLSSLNIAHLIDFSGIVRETNGNDVFVSYYTDYRDYVAPYFTISGGILHARYSGAWNGGEWNVILKYTKTTD